MMLLRRKAVSFSLIIIHVAVYGISGTLFAQENTASVDTAIAAVAGTAVTGGDTAEAAAALLVEDSTLSHVKDSSARTSATVKTSVDPAARTEPSPVAVDTVENGPVPSSLNYDGRSAMYPRGERGAAAAPTFVKTERKRIIDTLPAAATSLPDSETIALPGQVKNDAAENPLPVDTTAALPVSASAKIAAAIGTTLLIGGIVTYFILKQRREADDNAQDRIPLPPSPPGI
jgi:hypothetical protein